MPEIKRYSVLSEKVQELLVNYTLYEIIFALSEAALLIAKKIRPEDERQKSWNKFKVLLTCLDGLTEAAKISTAKQDSSTK